MSAAIRFPCPAGAREAAARAVRAAINAERCPEPEVLTLEVAGVELSCEFVAISTRMPGEERWRSLEVGARLMEGAGEVDSFGNPLCYASALRPGGAVGAKVRAAWERSEPVGDDLSWELFEMALSAARAKLSVCGSFLAKASAMEERGELEATLGARQDAGIPAPRL